MIGEQLRKDYENGTLCGWAEKRNPGILKAQFNIMGAPKTFNHHRSTGKKKMFLHWIVRKLLGKDTPNYPQEIGDCVSFGAKNAAEYVTCAQILGNILANAKRAGVDPAEAIAAGAYKFRYVFAPYYYGTGRTYVGKGQLGTNDDGSLGIWMAEAVRKYGTLFADDPNVPKYSGSVARAWGDPRPAPDLDKFKGLALDNPIKETEQINSWDELVKAICEDLAPCPTASDIGYNMEASSDGFHRQTTSWAHQMCFIGVDDNDTDPYALLLNNWGDAHGRLKDFDTGEDLPIGILRVRRKDVEKHIRQEETYAYKNFDAEKAALIDKSLFRVMGG